MSEQERAPEAVRYPVFRDKNGNRFVFPSVYSFESQSASWSYCRGICAALGVEEEADTLNVVPEDGFLNFPRVVASAGSSGFEHGSSEVWLIGGPEFDAIANADVPASAP
jgi:hypothetical protein